MVSISPQSVASLAASHDMSAEDVGICTSILSIAMIFLKNIQTAFRLVSFFKSLGVNYVFDITLARDLALLERYTINLNIVCYRCNTMQYNKQCKGVYQQI